MDRSVIKELQQEHKGKIYNYHIGALAKNVETDESHQFVTNKEKENIAGIESIKQAFQDGCDLLVSTCTTYGETPNSNSPSDIANAIGEIYSKRYSEGYNKGYADRKSDLPDEEYEVSLLCSASNNNTHVFYYPTNGCKYMDITVTTKHSEMYDGPSEYRQSPIRIGSASDTSKTDYTNADLTNGTIPCDLYAAPNNKNITGEITTNIDTSSTKFISLIFTAWSKPGSGVSDSAPVYIKIKFHN